MAFVLVPTCSSVCVGGGGCVRARVCVCVCVCVWCFHYTNMQWKWQMFSLSPWLINLVVSFNLSMWLLLQIVSECTLKEQGLQNDSNINMHFVLRGGGYIITCTFCCTLSLLLLLLLRLIHFRCGNIYSVYAISSDPLHVDDRSIPSI